MAEIVHNDVVEQILLQLDVKDLIRYRSVCKSWHSLITRRRFIDHHLNRSYNKDRYNNQLGHTRITLFTRSGFYNPHCLVGSSNGLVCMIYSKFNIRRHRHLVVGNPLTKEVRKLKYPPYIGLPLCWGFGYDSSRDDYKVIVGAKKGGNRICVRMLSLKSNVWRVIGDVKYRWCVTENGILCNGALHWIVNGQNSETFIISYDLSKDKLKEIPKPVTPRYEYYSHLGIMKDCLCIFGYSCVDKVKLMKKYNVKESWELLPRGRDREMKDDIVHFLRPGLPKDDDASWFFRSFKHLYWEYMDAHIYVESLVSPHVKSLVSPNVKEKSIKIFPHIDARPKALV